MDALKGWLDHPALLWGLGCFSVLAVIFSLLFVPRYLASLPPDFLANGEEPHGSVVWRILRNSLGVVLVVLGLLMLALPGQGLLTLAVGVLLVDFPGKHKLVQRLLGRPKILDVVNKLRARHGSPPLAT